MTSANTTKLVFGLLTTGVVGTATYGIYEFNRETIENKLKGTLLTKNAEDNSKWEARVALLKKETVTNLSTSLQKIKSDNTKVSDIQEWCDSNLKSKFSSEEDQTFKEIQKYCVYNIKEKAGEVAEITSWSSSKHDKKLKAFQEGTDKKLSATMKKIKQDLEKQPNPVTDALKDWCKKSYDKPYKGEKDQDYLDTKEYCANSQ